jgi:hypothetical protein
MSTEIVETIKKVPESSGFVKITPEVNMDSRVLYLIRINKEEVAFVNSEEEAKLVVDSVAAGMIGELENKSTEVYRKDAADGAKVVISKKDLGTLYNSSVYSVMEIDFLPVGHAVLTKGRHELPTAVPTPPPLPPNSVLLASLARIRAGVKGKPVSLPEKDEKEEEQKASDSESE